MKVTKKIEKGQVFVGVELTEDEKIATHDVIVDYPSGRDHLDRCFHIGGGVEISYAGETTFLHHFDYTLPVDEIAKTIESNLQVALNLIANATSKCGTVDIISKQSAMEFLATENRLYYRTQAGEIAPLI